MKVIDNIKEHLAEKSIKKVLAFQNRHTYYPDFKTIKNILILFKSEDNEKNKFIRDIISDFKNQGKKVTAWGFLDKKDCNAAVLPDYRLFGTKELTYYNIPNQTLTDEFLIGEYDIVIQLCATDIYALDFLLAQAKAPFKVSKAKPYKGISDFMISLDETADEEFLYNQILFYLNNIQAKN